MADPKNTLHYGDNLDVLRRYVKDETVDLIYLDPPFNSNRSYNVLFRTKSGDDAQAQIEAFDDTWTWSQQSEAEYAHLTQGGSPPKVADAIESMRKLLGDNDVLAYLVMMTARLVELHRVLKESGSLYLHCDPTASHYLKVMLDAIFGQRNFMNEIAWCYRGGGVPRRAFARKHDTIFFYAKRRDHNFFSPQYVPYSEASQALVSKRGGVSIDDRPRDLERGAHMPDWWTDINGLQTWSPERLGYPTQKPIALLERIIKASSDEGAVILDPFCGCGTAIDAAQQLGRRWIGIDISYLSVALIRERLVDRFGDEIADTFDVVGIPRDLAGAEALFKSNAFDFERWAVSAVGGRANEKQVGDKGSDGVIRFPLDKTNVGRIIVSVKGGGSVNPGMVRDLRGTVERAGAEMGVLITLTPPTKGMIEEVNGSGSYKYALNGELFPRLQIITISELLAGKRLNAPPAYPAYVKAKAASDPGEQGELPI